MQYGLGTVVALLQRVTRHNKAAALHHQRGQRQRIAARPGSADLAPGPAALAVGVEREADVKIVQGDVLTRIAALGQHDDEQVGVAGLAGLGRVLCQNTSQPAEDQGAQRALRAKLPQPAKSGWSTHSAKSAKSPDAARTGDTA